jgi:N-acetyl-anhydromuramyl-L-alanine amidase AmpD
MIEAPRVRRADPTPPSIRPLHRSHRVLADMEHERVGERLGAHNVRAVRELQRLLRKRGYPVTVDGDFGRKTWEAVSAFQSQHLDAHGQQFVSDGKGGPLTRVGLI